ncbi:MAG: hypothetical protein CMJ95_10770 [Planctomycetes bacterium]|nr:hypothetical protein [Planctomycetota bacterium]
MSTNMGKWSCSVCTYVNPDTASRCQMCESTAPNVSEPHSQSYNSALQSSFMSPTPDWPH